MSPNDLNSRSLPIAEAFTSIQGEGVRTGSPSRFIRVAGCNLRCGWCDTPYASWAPEGDAVSIETLVQDTARAGVPDAVLTGGEPLLFDAIEPLSRALRAAGLHITIETAGTIHRPPANDDSGLACDLMSLSPKLSTSTPAADDPRDPTGVWRERHEQRRIDLEALQRLLNDYPCRQIKFVATAPADLTEIDQLLSRLTGWKPGEIMLMPEGVTTPKPGATDWVVQACLDRGWRYCHRLHIELFGNTRGT